MVFLLEKGEPVGVGFGVKLFAEGAKIGLDAKGDSPSWILEGGRGTDVDEGGVGCPFEDVFRDESASKVENEIGFRGIGLANEVIEVADLFGCGGGTGVREEIGKKGPF